MKTARPFILAAAASVLFAGSSLPALAAVMDDQPRRGDRQIQDRPNVRGGMNRESRAGARTRSNPAIQRSAPSPRSNPAPRSRPSPPQRDFSSRPSTPQRDFNPRPPQNNNRVSAPRNTPERRLVGDNRPGTSSRPAVLNRYQAGDRDMRERANDFRNRTGSDNRLAGRPDPRDRAWDGDRRWDNNRGNDGRYDRDRDDRRDRDWDDRRDHDRDWNGRHDHDRDWDDRNRRHRYSYNNSHKRYAYGYPYYGHRNTYSSFSLNIAWPRANYYNSSYGYFWPVRYWCPLHGFYHEGYYSSYSYQPNYGYTHYSYNDYYGDGYWNYANNCRYRYVRTQYRWEREQVCFDRYGRLYVRY
ncbi:MAG: hypothetical protein H2040_07430 [Euryhalocaulis sp.]|uniref:hypothetical protein n=1 Tax=Euryhalocaulis sp. TaxID=2744307 RepID=UPI0018024B34|nr:hypothetical protein [Euryhalocaulis sp.]MBA4801679.1 hypothetical protein [Euryhalocaulis sp.]